MRLLKLNLFALAVLLLTFGTANAYRVDLQTSYDQVSVLGVSDIISVNVLFDSEGQGNVALLAVGVVFDDTVLEYVPGASSTPSYLLYVNGKTPYLAAASTCIPVCGLFGLAPFNQVQLDFTSSSLPSGVPTATPAGGVSLGTYVFHVIGAGQGLSEIGFIFSIERGGILQLGDNTTPPLTLGAPITVVTPEPTTAVLIGLGLVGLGVAGRRRE